MYYIYIIAFATKPFKPQLMEILYLFIGLIAGGIGIYLYHKSALKTALNELILAYQQKTAHLDKEISLLRNDLLHAKAENEKLITELGSEKSKAEYANNRLAKAEVEFKNLNEKLNLQKEEQLKLQERLHLEFENLANKILKQNTQEFSQSNRKSIDEILSPLKEKIQLFEKRVDDTHKENISNYSAFREQLHQLKDLNQKMNQEAMNLTKALKGDVKMQGNWGEFQLEKILEASGLRKGSEYIVQAKEMNLVNEEGQRLQPDMIITLPEEKHLIIDSKVSLLAYTNYVSTELKEEKEQFVRDLVSSIKSHINNLHSKHYQDITALNSPDFVLLFMPLEPALGVVLQNDISIYNYAWSKKIVMVTPSTLLATLMTVASLWKQEKQTRNALEIARQGGALYDKFVGFLEDMLKIKKGIEQVNKAYDESVKKLKDGNNNLLIQTEKLKKLGAKASKTAPTEFTAGVIIEETELEITALDQVKEKE